MTLAMWTIYDRPRDYPDCFVARKFLSIGGEPEISDTVIFADTLTEARYMIYLLDPNASEPLPRMPGDHPSVVETWI